MFSVVSEAGRGGGGCGRTVAAGAGCVRGRRDDRPTRPARARAADQVHDHGHPGRGAQGPQRAPGLGLRQVGHGLPRY